MHWKFERDQLLYVSSRIYFNDQFGTLSTGEAGYLCLVEIVDRFKRASTMLLSVIQAACADKKRSMEIPLSCIEIPEQIRDPAYSYVGKAPTLHQHPSRNVFTRV
jgi:hypothetical protein